MVTIMPHMPEAGSSDKDNPALTEKTSQKISTSDFMVNAVRAGYGKLHRQSENPDIRKSQIDAKAYLKKEGFVRDLLTAQDHTHIALAGRRYTDAMPFINGPTGILASAFMKGVINYIKNHKSDAPWAQIPESGGPN